MRFLLVTSSVPWPTHTGGNQRTNLLHRALSRRGDVDTVVVLRYGTLPEDQRRVAAEQFGGRLFFDNCLPEHYAPWRWMRCLGRGAPAQLAHTIGGWQSDFRPDRRIARDVAALIDEGKYDAVVGRYLWPTARSGALGRLPTLLDADDFETDVVETILSSQALTEMQSRWVRRRLGQVKRMERKLLQRCDHVWLTKRDDAARVPHEQWEVLPNIPFCKAGRDAPDPCPPNADAHQVLFVGTLEHPINVRAVDRFVKGPWLQIHRRTPQLVLHIVGSGLTRDMRERWSSIEGVIPAGYVDDLREAYHNAAFTVVPIWEGGGTKIKVLESLRMGRACVSADHSVRGYDHVLKPGRDIETAANDDELVDACVSLWLQPEKRQAMAEHSLQVVKEHFSYTNFENTVNRANENVLINEKV